jgi:LuxR family maltose regulon positive regulatory protein
MLQYLSQGMTREEIADFLSLSVNTVKSAIQNIYSKLGAVNKADAVRIGSSLGIIG